MIHIALVTTSYPDGSPGAEAAGGFVADFAAELASRVRVTVVAASRGDSVASDGYLAVRRFAVPKQPLSLLRPTRPTDWGQIVTSIRSGARALDHLACEDAPDYILALWALPSGYWAYRTSRRHGIPYGVWALGSDIWSLGKIPIVKQWLRQVLRRASHRYADGYELAADVKRIGGKACEFLPSTRSLNADRVTPLAEVTPYKLAFLGRWHENKGADLLINALKLLDDEDWSRIAEVRFFGGGPLDEYVCVGAEKLSKAGRPINIGGYLDKASAAELIGWADYLLLPSRIESIPVIFSDAMQLGTPLVSTPVGDLARLHDIYNFGVLAAAATANDYAAALRSALSGSPGTFSGGVERARLEFDISTAAERFLEDTSCRKS